MPRFVVKFYMPDPSQLEEEYTRYLAALQVLTQSQVYSLYAVTSDSISMKPELQLQAVFSWTL